MCKRPWPEFSLFLNQFHTVSPKIETEFLGKLWSLNVFSAQKQEVSKKKRSSPKLRLNFRPKSKIQTIFHTESQYPLHDFGTQFPLGGGCFQFFTKNRPKKQQKRTILHTSQANGGGARAPPPPWLRYCIREMSDKSMLGIWKHIKVDWAQHIWQIVPRIIWKEKLVTTKADDFGIVGRST